MVVYIESVIGENGSKQCTNLVLNHIKKTRSENERSRLTKLTQAAHPKFASSVRKSVISG